MALATPRLGGGDFRVVVLGHCVPQGTSPPPPPGLSFEGVEGRGLAAGDGLPAVVAGFDVCDSGIAGSGRTSGRTKRLGASRTVWARPKEVARSPTRLFMRRAPALDTAEDSCGAARSEPPASAFTIKVACRRRR